MMYQFIPFFIPFYHSEHHSEHTDNMTYEEARMAYEKACRELGEVRFVSSIFFEMLALFIVFAMAYIRLGMIPSFVIKISVAAVLCNFFSLWLYSKKKEGLAYVIFMTSFFIFSIFIYMRRSYLIFDDDVIMYICALICALISLIELGSLALSHKKNQN